MKRTEPEHAAHKSPAALLLTVAGVLGRLIPHPPNFAPVGAASLFSGARLPWWQAYLVPIAVMAATDPILGAYYGVPAFSRAQIFIYASFLISVAIGRAMRHRLTVPRIAAATLLCATQFFFITNFAVWLTSTIYPATPAGLAACYIAGIPFFGWTLAGNVVYSAVLFGLEAWISRLTQARTQPAAA